MREPEHLLDERCESSSTYSTASTIWGPGALTGKFLKALGEKSLGFIESVVIRIRLANMRQILEKTPHIFIDPQTPEECRQANEMYNDLKELCREKYSLSLRRTAANLILDIVLYALTSGQISMPEPSTPSETSHSCAAWRRLLVPLQHPGGLLRVPQETIVTVDRQTCEASEASKTAAVPENIRPIGPDNPIKVGVTVEITQSFEPTDKILSRRIPLIGTRILRRRRRRNPERRRLYDSDAQLREGPKLVPNTSIPAERPAGLFPVYSKWEFTNVSGISQVIQNRIGSFRRSPIPSSRSIPQQIHSSRLHTSKGLDAVSGLNGTRAPLGLGAEHWSDPPSVAYTDAGSKIKGVEHESVIPINEPIVRGRRMVSHILRELECARKTVHDLEVELMDTSLDYVVPKDG